MKKNIYIAPKSRVVEFRLRTHIAAGSTMEVREDEGGNQIAEGKQSGMWSYLEFEEEDDY